MTDPILVLKNTKVVLNGIADGKTLYHHQKRISEDITIRKRDSWKMYCDDMELSEDQGATWCKIGSVLTPKSAQYNYPILVSRDEGGIKTGSVTTTEKLEIFVSQLEVFTSEIENNVFAEEVKTDVDAELDQPIARARLYFQNIIPFAPYINPAGLGNITQQMTISLSLPKLFVRLNDCLDVWVPYF